MLPTHAVGIDLGTTYSCIAYLNEHGEPVTLPNQEGELSTPSVVLIEQDHVTVGTEALRNAIVHPDRVIQNSKRVIGDPNYRWMIDSRPFTPVDVAAFILKKLLSAAQEQIGPIEQAVITVPAQFGDAQRHATMEAGHRAGLQQVDIINEPVAASLCYVLGSEGLWFTELAQSQRILVYDLGGGTFDLSLVNYQQNEVSVIASSGDLNLGGIDWNRALLDAIAGQFVREFGQDPRSDPQSLQALSLEVEQTKRSLSVRPRASLLCHHGGHRKTYQVEQAQFEKICRPLVDRTADITKAMLKSNKMGWAHVDVVLTTGGSSRMPMVRNKLKELSGRTLNTSLSPDMSIAHGATYYAGMLISNSKFARSILNDKATERLAKIRQRSVNARGLGIMVRDVERNERVPYYLLPPNTPLPADVTHTFGTVKPDQRRVNLQIVESGYSDERPPVGIGNCVIEDLPPNLPEGSEIAVTISYDSQARIHVSAIDVASGKRASTEIIRQENLVPQLASDHRQDVDVAVLPENRTSSQVSSSTGGGNIANEAMEKSGRPEASIPRPKPIPPPLPTPPSPPSPSPQPRPNVTPEVRSVPQVRGIPATSAGGSSTGTSGSSPPASMKGPAAALVSARNAPAQNAPPAKKPPATSPSLVHADRPIPLCNECGEVLDVRGRCPACEAAGASPALRQPRSAPASREPKATPRTSAPTSRGDETASSRPATPQKKPSPRPIPVPNAVRPASGPRVPPLPSPDEKIVDLANEQMVAPGTSARKPRPATPPQSQSTERAKKRPETGEDEFWQMVE